MEYSNILNNPYSDINMDSNRFVVIINGRISYLTGNIDRIEKPKIVV
jgi:hypothetical protein